jgi:pyruvoyl-dependent arginine decarboxylase (PvlArgDC)
MQSRAGIKYHAARLPGDFTRPGPQGAQSWDEKKEIFKISGKIVSTRNITQSSIVQSHGYTTVIAVAVFVF